MISRGVFWIAATVFCLGFWGCLGALLVEVYGAETMIKVGLALGMGSLFAGFGYAVIYSVQARRKQRQEEAWESNE